MPAFAMSDPLDAIGMRTVSGIAQDASVMVASIRPASG